MSADVSPAERVSDSDAIKALARVVNTGGDAEAKDLLDTYVSQGDEAPTSASYSYTADASKDDSVNESDEDEDGGEGGNDSSDTKTAATAAGRRAKP